VASSSVKPVGLTSAELAVEEQRTPLPDIEPCGKPWLGSARGQLAQRDARIRELELHLALAERVLVSQRSIRADADEVLEGIARVLAPTRTM
jgi:hypothetical protein